MSERASGFLGRSGHGGPMGRKLDFNICRMEAHAAITIAGISTQNRDI